MIPGQIALIRTPVPPSCCEMVCTCTKSYENMNKYWCYQSNVVALVWLVWAFVSAIERHMIHEIKANLIASSFRLEVMGELQHVLNEAPGIKSKTMAVKIPDRENMRLNKRKPHTKFNGALCNRKDVLGRPLPPSKRCKRCRQPPTVCQQLMPCK